MNVLLKDYRIIVRFLTQKNSIKPNLDFANFHFYSNIFSQKYLRSVLINNNNEKLTNAGAEALIPKPNSQILQPTHVTIHFSIIFSNTQGAFNFSVLCLRPSVM